MELKIKNENSYLQSPIKILTFKSIILNSFSFLKRKSVLQLFMSVNKDTLIDVNNGCQQIKITCGGGCCV